MINNNTEKEIKDHELHEKIHKIFSMAKETSLSHKEKIEGGLTLQTFMKMNTAGETSGLSPYIKNIFISTFTFFKQRQLVALALAIVLVFCGAGGTAYASSNSLPGDLLYPVKINIYEKLETAFARGTEAKTRVSVKHAVTRIDEVEKLAVEGRIDKSDEQSVNAGVALQSKEVQDNILKLKVEGNIDAAIRISSDFENSLNDHKKNLENITSDATTTSKSFLSKTRENIRDNILNSAKERLVLESSLSASSTLVINKKIANDGLTSFQKKIKKIEVSVNASQNIDEETETILKAAVKTIAESEEKINVGAYSNAVVLLKDAREHTEKLEEKFKKASSAPIIPVPVPSVPSVPSGGLLH